MKQMAIAILGLALLATACGAPTIAPTLTPGPVPTVAPTKGNLAVVFASPTPEISELVVKFPTATPPVATGSEVSIKLAQASWVEVPASSPTSHKGLNFVSQLGNGIEASFQEGSTVYVSVDDGKKPPKQVTLLGVEKRNGGGLKAGQATGLFSWNIINVPGDMVVLTLVGHPWGLAVRFDSNNKPQAAFFAAW